MIHGIDELSVDIDTSACVGRLRVHNVYQRGERQGKATSFTGTYCVWVASSSEGLSVSFRTRSKGRPAAAESAMTKSLVVEDGI
jgi:hypothetical protein